MNIHVTNVLYKLLKINSQCSAHCLFNILMSYLVDNVKDVKKNPKAI